MAALRSKQADREMRCSFCQKTASDVCKLISNPSDYPARAYICDECVEVCNSIIEEDKRAREPYGQALRGGGRFVQHPLAVEFLNAAERWAVRDLTGLSASDELNHLRGIAVRMLAEQSLSGA